MTITIPRLTEAQAVTVLNAVVSFMQYTLGAAVVIVLFKVISNVQFHSAITWSVIARELHASLWPTVLRTESSHGAAPRVAWLSRLGIVSSILVAVAGVVTPLGLQSGPLIASRNFRPMNAVYVEDNSPLASATSPRSSYFYYRPCNDYYDGPCPGNSNAETTEISPSTIEQFNSTSHGPFNMQFRRYFRSPLLPKNASDLIYTNMSVIEGKFSALESFILRDDVFSVEGAIVDMSVTPGIGLTNHTMPTSLKYGGTWSQELLWLEPATTCVDTNLTVDYSLGSYQDIPMNNSYLTDRGGFVQFISPLDRDGQRINLYEHAYAGAIYSNMYNLITLYNFSRNASHVGKAVLLHSFNPSFNPGVMQTISLRYLHRTSRDFDLDVDILCTGYGGQDTANITNVGAHCGAFLGPPYRTDGGDDKSFDMGSMWRQNLHVCVSVTKASIQRVDYSFNGTTDLTNLRITRSPKAQPVLWAMEKTNMTIFDAVTYWGRVADSYDANRNLSTIRATTFYLPASASDIFGIILSGQAHTIPAVAWNNVYNDLIGTSSLSGLVDYTGKTNAALLKKYQSIISSESNPAQGVARICNLIWTDLVANSLLGTDMSTILMVAEYHPSITYDLKYGMLLILLILIWLPSFTTALFLLASGKLKFSEIKNLLNHTSVGRIVTGYSALTMQKVDVDEPDIPTHVDTNENDWAATAGRTLLSYKPNGPADGHKDEIELLHPSTSERNEEDSFGNRGEHYDE